MSDFLKNYLDHRRSETGAQVESEETSELLGSLNSNIGLVARNTKSNESTSKKILGTLESQVAIQQQRDNVYAQFTKEQLGAFYDFSDYQRSQTRTLSKHLRELSASLREAVGSKLEASNKSLAEIAEYLKPDTTHSKRDDEARKIAERLGISQKPKAEKERKKSRSLVDDVTDLFDFDDSDRKKKKGKGRGKGKLGRAKTVGGLGEAAGKSSWWDKIKGKAGQAAEGIAESGKGLFSKMPGALKAGAGVLGKLAVPVGAALDVGSGISDLLDGKRQTEMPSGWDMLSPMRWGMYAGEKVNQGYEAASLSMGGSGNMIEDSINGAKTAGDTISTAFTTSFLGAPITEAFKTSIIPGFNNVANNMGKFADDFGTSATRLVTGLGKDFEELGDDLKGGARAVWAGAKQFAQAPVATTVGAAKSAAKAVDEKTGGWIRKGIDAVRGESGGLSKGRFTEEEQAAIKAARANGEKFRGGSGLSADQKAKIDEASKKYGVDAQAMKTMAQIESGGNSNAVSATGAVGMYQFTGGTGKQYGIKNRFDETQNIDAAARLMRDNKAALEKLGIEATPQNLYLAHQQGAGGAAKIINAAKNGTQLDPETAKNMGLNYGNMSAKDYLAANEKKFAAAQKASEKTVERTQLASNKAATPVGTKPNTQTATADASTGKPVETTAEKKTILATAPQEAAPKAEKPKSTVTVAASKQASQVASVTPEPSVAAKKAPQPMVDQSAPVEAKPVQVANAGDISPKVEVQAPVAASSATSNTTNPTVPSLDSIPLQITDMGLILLNVGHI